jgi:hypothetical protein
MEPGHAKGRKGRTMYNHESSKSDYTCIFLEEPLTDCSLGNDCCYRVGSAHRLEGRGQRKRRMVLLAQRTLEHLVLLRDRRHNHRPMHPRITTLTTRHPYILNITKTSVHPRPPDCQTQKEQHIRRPEHPPSARLLQRKVHIPRQRRDARLLGQPRDIPEDGL